MFTFSESMTFESTKFYEIMKLRKSPDETKGIDSNLILRHFRKNQCVKKCMNSELIKKICFFRFTTTTGMVIYKNVDIMENKEFF